MNKWNKRFVRLAKEYSTWSKDPSSQIGAVAIDPVSKRILSGGYNGFPRGIADTPERLNDRPTKHKYVVHAEANMIYNATHAGVNLAGSHVYVWGLPICSECAKAIIQVGVSKVYIVLSTVSKSPYYQESWELSKSMFEECGIEINEIEGDYK
jgi:dCMP deaminase